jgi:hypothetical protein
LEDELLQIYEKYTFGTLCQGENCDNIGVLTALCCGKTAIFRNHSKLLHGNNIIGE